MGLFSGMMSNATEVDISKVENEIGPLLADGENLEHAYKLVRDLFVFTDKRMIIVDKQGMTAKKVAYHSIPYRSIIHYEIETAGHMDLEAELKIWLSGRPDPIVKEFRKDNSIYEVQKVMTAYICK